jgi:hypothetical protein
MRRARGDLRGRIAYLRGARWLPQNDGGTNAMTNPTFGAKFRRRDTSLLRGRVLAPLIAAQFSTGASKNDNGDDG